jgi:hypothetical protein
VYVCGVWGVGVRGVGGEVSVCVCICVYVCVYDRRREIKSITEKCRVCN